MKIIHNGFSSIENCGKFNEILKKQPKMNEIEAYKN
jgi:hypothetical protein